MNEENRHYAEPSFEAWYSSAYPKIFRYALAATRDEALARDVSSEVCTKVFSRWHDISRIRSIDGWVFRIAGNELKRHWRRRAREDRALRRLGVVEAAAPFSRDPDLWDAVNALPLRQRQVVILRYVIGLSEREIGDALQVSEGAVSASLVTARKKLASDGRVALDG